MFSAVAAVGPGYNPNITDAAHSVRLVKLFPEHRKKQRKRERDVCRLASIRELARTHEGGKREERKGKRSV